LNPFDIILLILLVLGAYEGFKKGFLLGLIGLVGFVVAVVLGFHFMDSMTVWLAEHVTEFNIAYPIVAFLIIFGISTLLIQVVGKILKKIMNIILLGSLDSLAGAGLGIVRVSFFISLFIWLGKEFEIDLSKRWTAESEMLEFIEPMAPVVIEVVKPVFPVVGGVQKLKDLVEGFKDAAPDR
jgi:membrane protein required for colicin V production